MVVPVHNEVIKTQLVVAIRTTQKRCLCAVRNLAERPHRASLEANLDWCLKIFITGINVADLPPRVAKERPEHWIAELVPNDLKNTEDISTLSKNEWKRTSQDVIVQPFHKAFEHPEEVDVKRLDEGCSTWWDVANTQLLAVRHQCLNGIVILKTGPRVNQ